MVLVITGVLATMAVCGYAHALVIYRAKIAGQRVASDVALAQSAAKTTSAGQSIVFTLATSSYTLPSYQAPLNGPTQSTYTVNLASDPYQATLVSAAFNGSTTLTYNRFGLPSSGGSVVLQVGTSQLVTVTVDPNTGKASVQ